MKEEPSLQNGYPIRSFGRTLRGIVLQTIRPLFLTSRRQYQHAPSITRLTFFKISSISTHHLVVSFLFPQLLYSKPKFLMLSPEKGCLQHRQYHGPLYYVAGLRESWFIHKACVKVHKWCQASYARYLLEQRPIRSFL